MVTVTSLSRPGRDEAPAPRPGGGDADPADGTNDERVGGDAAPSARSRAVARTAVAVLTIAEACGLLGVALWWASGAIRGGEVRGSEAFLAVFALAVAAVLVASVRLLVRGRRGARGPVVTWQVLQAATATTVLGVPAARGWAAGAVVVAVVVVALLLVPGVAAVRSGVDPAPPESA